MKVLISAYSCRPGVGSEPGAAWTWALGAARHHDVWLLTEPSNEPFVTAAIAQAACARLRPVYVPLPWWAQRPYKTTMGLRARYVLWQLRLSSFIRALHAEEKFDVVHHLTLAADWLPSGITSLDDVPMVWGPVGGCAPVLPALWWRVSPSLFASEVVRLGVTGTARTLIGQRIAKRADLVIAQNHQVARRFEPWSDVLVEQNSALVADEFKIPDSNDHEEIQTGHRAVFVGRLLPWKGLSLAIETLAQPAASGWTLDVIGAGSDRRRAEKLVSRWGLSDRVRLLGTIPRPEVIGRMARADALLFPSLHDSAPWTVAEALTLGCPVVCLDIAGPGEMVKVSGGTSVPPRGNVVRGLADALASIHGRLEPTDHWSVERIPDTIDGWYERAIANRRQRATQAASC